MLNKLNLGCGGDYKKGWVNLDCNSNIKSVPDIVYNLNNIPWKPFKNNQFDEIFASHIIEHFPNPLEIFEELYRISKNGGVIKIKVPHWSHYFAFTDMTHKTFFSINSFRLLDSNLKYYDRKFKFKLKFVKYNNSLGFLRKIINKILNLNPILTENILCRMIPIKEIVAELIVIK